jgi:hypothetical protein
VSGGCVQFVRGASGGCSAARPAALSSNRNEGKAPGDVAWGFTAGAMAPAETMCESRLFDYLANGAK